MITYELMLMLRVMPKPECKQVLRRIADHIFQTGGFIRKLDNMGTRDIPHKISSHGIVYRQASYFLYEFNVPPSSVDYLLDEYRRDVDIIKPNIFKKQEVEPFECTLHEECLPPPYRKDVQNLMAESKKHEKPTFKYNSGLNYYPFQK